MQTDSTKLTDTAKLLKECDAGTKMAISSINEILEKELKRCSSRISERCHERLGNKIKMIEIGLPYLHLNREKRGNKGL